MRFNTKCITFYTKCSRFLSAAVSNTKTKNKLWKKYFKLSRVPEGVSTIVEEAWQQAGRKRSWEFPSSTENMEWEWEGKLYEATKLLNSTLSDIIPS